MSLILIPLFLVVAFIYSMVGFGGGSSYIALLVIFDLPHEHIPVVALVCNLAVVTIGSINFIRAGHLSVRMLLPFIVSSVPAAYVAGSVHADQRVFLFVLGSVLLLAGIRMLFNKHLHPIAGGELKPKIIWIWGPIIGAVLGGISGFVGIGGGIFLAPVLNTLGWGKPKQVAAIASVFIFVNSLSGLSGQLSKFSELSSLAVYAGLPCAVLIGGFCGSFLGASKVDQAVIYKITAVIVLLAACRILTTLF